MYSESNNNHFNSGTNYLLNFLTCNKFIDVLKLLGRKLAFSRPLDHGPKIDQNLLTDHGLLAYPLEHGPILPHDGTPSDLMRF
jgi:hypothetical protein